MKHFNKIYLMLVTAGIFYGSSLAAQNAKFQVIHNASGILLDTVDVYLNNLLIDNMSFRSATALQTIPAGDYLFSVNHRSSADSSDQVLFSQTITLGTSNANMIVITGVDTPANYAANPDARSTGLSIIHRKNVGVQASNGALGLTFIHGTTDLAAISIVNRPNTSEASNLSYGDSTNNIFRSAVEAVWDLRSGGNILKTYRAPLGNFNRKSLVVLTSGFRFPSANQNGAALALITVDTNGIVNVLDEVSRFQIINTSPDTSLNSVDVYINNIKIASNLAFQQATPFNTVIAGMHEIKVAIGNSDTVVSSNILYQTSLNLPSGGTNVAMIKGVIHSANFPPNPQSMATSFSISVASFSEFSNSGIDLEVLNMVPDANQLDINRITPTAQQLASNIGYNTIAYSNTTANNGLINITNADSSVNYGTYRMALAGQTGKTGILLTTGFFSSASGLPPFQPILVLNDGSVQILSKLGSEIQIVHNSADTNIAFVDVYIDGALALNNFEFRKATPFMQLDAFNPHAIAIADSGSTSATGAFYNTSLTLDSSVSYYVILTGLKTTTGYESNPEGRDRSFKIVTYKGAQKLASNNKNVDLLFYHGATDLSIATIKGLAQVQFLCKNKGYGEFHGYGIHSAADALKFDITDTTGYSDEMFGNLKDHQGLAGLVFASGFKKETTAQSHYPLMLMIAWADGNVDSIAPLRLIGMEEMKNLSANSVALYPNPATSEVNVSFDLNTSATASIQLIDITGRVVLSKNINATKGQNLIPLSVSTLNRGLYFMNVSSEGKSVTKKLIIE